MKPLSMPAPPSHYRRNEGSKDVGIPDSRRSTTSCLLFSRVPPRSNSRSDPKDRRLAAPSWRHGGCRNFDRTHRWQMERDWRRWDDVARPCLPGPERRFWSDAWPHSKWLFLLPCCVPPKRIYPPWTAMHSSPRTRFRW